MGRTSERLQILIIMIVGRMEPPSSPASERARINQRSLAAAAAVARACRGSHFRVLFLLRAQREDSSELGQRVARASMGCLFESRRRASKRANRMAPLLLCIRAGRPREATGNECLSGRRAGRRRRPLAQRWHEFMQPESECIFVCACVDSNLAPGRRRRWRRLAGQIQIVAAGRSVGRSVARGRRANIISRRGQISNIKLISPLMCPLLDAVVATAISILGDARRTLARSSTCATVQVRK